MRGNGRIFKRKGTNLWWCAYYLRGREIRESTGCTEERAARRFLRRRLKEVGADDIGARPFTGPEQDRVTVNEILDDMIVEYKRGGRKRIPREVSPQMESQLRPLRKYFGLCRAPQVGTKEIEGFIAQLKRRRRANATINRSLQLLGQAYRYAANTDPPKLNRVLKINLLDESDNVRKGKLSPAEVDLVASSLPSYMRDVSEWAYQTGRRPGEILKYEWPDLDDDALNVRGEITKNREPDSIALTEELKAILARRKVAAVPGCDLIFHHDGKPIIDYRKCWHSACVANGLGVFYCRDCRDQEGRYLSALDAVKKCPRCGKKWENPKYIGKLLYDLKRSACHEMWLSGNSIEDCMKMTGHKTSSMFKRYADLFTKEEKQARQRDVQQRRREWRQAQVEKVVGMPTRVTVQ